MSKRNIVIAITGASGSVYARILFEKLLLISEQLDEVAIVFSGNAKEIWKYELDEEFIPIPPFRIYQNDDFFAPFASGSSRFDTMIVCPCSMSAVARIANGISDDLITRASDVMLKERRRLILVPREMPFSLVHIENMKSVTLAGGIICPAIPSFYHKPENMEQLLGTVVDRVLHLAEFTIASFEWGKS